MKKTVCAALVAGSLFLIPEISSAESLTPTKAPVNFSLSVAGNVVSHTTFWVSYGPLNGRFAVRQLHRIAGGRYGITLQLPAGAKGTFYYLSGRGAVQTRAGLVPGDPVTTIRQVMLKPALALTPRRFSVSWHAPVG
jgi:hypothetical protein